MITSSVCFGFAIGEKITCVFLLSGVCRGWEAERRAEQPTVLVKMKGVQFLACQWVITLTWQVVQNCSA